MPEANTEAMQAHLAEIGRRVRPGAHAVLVLDGAGWHGTPKLRTPDNISLLVLPPYAPELNPVENLWEFLRQNLLSHRVWDSYDAIVDACCAAWNWLMQMPDQIATRSCPAAWCSSADPRQVRVGQAATAGSLTWGASLKAARPSRVM
jgi:hypothetical protein